MNKQDKLNSQKPRTVLAGIAVSLIMASAAQELEGTDRIVGNHALEAVNYHTLDRALWS